jgi:hypothetical protein
VIDNAPPLAPDALTDPKHQVHWSPPEPAERH